ncbi:unnamed protein product [Rhizophagus irregularis]|nr:unnamed protein product [Rhizophagus irregularis]
MYSVFKATGHKLPSINTQASPSKIQEWKSKAELLLKDIDEFYRVMVRHRSNLKDGELVWSFNKLVI